MTRPARKAGEVHPLPPGRLEVDETLFERLIDAAEHYAGCDFPNEIAFRCDGCREANKAVEAGRKALERYRATLEAGR